MGAPKGMIEPEEYADDSRDKLEEIRHKSDAALERKALQRRERTITEERQLRSSKKGMGSAVMAVLVGALIIGAYLFVDENRSANSDLMLGNAAFKDAVERVMKTPNILKANFTQQLDSAQQIGVTLYIDYTVVDERAKEIGNEVMAMLTTPATSSKVADDAVGSRLYRYRIVMSRLDEREVASGMLAGESQQISWK